MKTKVLILMVSLISAGIDFQSQAQQANKRILVAYFSHSGNTQVIANQIHKLAGGDIFEIKTVKPYPNDYNVLVDQARQELNSGYRPALATKVENINLYDIVFIGYPDWWSTIPAPVRVFLTSYNFSGKTIIPFCTHEGSGLGRSVTDIRKLCPKSKVLEGFAVRGGQVHESQNEVSAWIKKLNIKKIGK